MNELTMFTSEEFGTIRSTTVQGEPYFIGKDVAEILGYKDTADAIQRHVDMDDKLTGCFTYSGQKRVMFIINESGLYSLILSSKLPAAKKFKKWVTSEVLPSIRKHGMYAMDELINNPDLAIKALTALKEEREKNAKLAAVNEELKPKAEIADAITESKDSISVGDMAKLLKQNGVEIGQNRFFDWLRTNGYLMAGNKPTQKAMELKVFEIKERNITLPSGTDKIVMTPKVTAKGQEYFLKKLAMAAV